jgi:hypothetical protein
MIPHRHYTVTAIGKVRMRLLTETAAEVNEKIKLGFGD